MKYLTKENVILLTSLVLIVCGIVLCFSGNNTGGGIIFGTAILCLIFVYLNRFDSFEGLGIKGKLKDLDQKISEADTILNQVKGIAYPMARMLISNVARQGRWGSNIPNRQKYELVEEIEKSLKELNCTDNDLEKCKKDWHWYNIIDLFSPIRKHLVEVLNKKIADYEKKNTFKVVNDDNREDHKRYMEERKVYYAEKKKFEDLSEVLNKDDLYIQVKNFINECKILTDEEKTSILQQFTEEIDDLEEYCKHRTFRRLDAWFARDEDKIIT